MDKITAIYGRHGIGGDHNRESVEEKHTVTKGRIVQHLPDSSRSYRRDKVDVAPFFPPKRTPRDIGEEHDEWMREEINRYMTARIKEMLDADYYRFVHGVRGIQNLCLDTSYRIKDHDGP